MTARLPELKGGFVAIPKGPRALRLIAEPVRYGVPGEPPPEFLGINTTRSEWPVYWGLAQIFKTPSPRRLREFPFNGGPPIWTYQGFVEAGRDEQTNVDFIVWGADGRATPLGIRVQTEYFHNFASNDTQIYDITQQIALESGFDVMNLYDYTYMRDTTGQAVIVQLKRMLGLLQGPRPQSADTAQRV